MLVTLSDGMRIAPLHAAPTPMARALSEGGAPLVLLASPLSLWLPPRSGSSHVYWHVARAVTVADALAGLTGPVFTGPVSGQSEVFTERPTFPV